MNEPMVCRSSFKQSHRRSRSESAVTHEVDLKLPSALPQYTAPPHPHSYMTTANRVRKVLDKEISSMRGLAVHDARKLATEMRQQFSPSVRKKNELKDMKLFQSYYQDTNENVLAFDNFGVFNFDMECAEEPAATPQKEGHADDKKVDMLFNEMQEISLDSDNESKSSSLVSDKFVAFLRKKGLNLRRSSANSLYNELDEDGPSSLSHANDFTYSHEHTSSFPSSLRVKDSLFKKMNLKKRR